MFGKALAVDDLEISICLNGGIDIPMRQASPVVVTCVMDGDVVERVHADEGIEFLTDGGFIGVSYKPCADISHLLERREWQKKLDKAADDNDAMRLHNSGL